MLVSLQSLVLIACVGCRVRVVGSGAAAYSAYKKKGLYFGEKNVEKWILLEKVEKKEREAQGFVLPSSPPLFCVQS